MDIWVIIAFSVIMLTACFLPVILLLKKEFGAINRNDAILSKGIKTIAVIKEIKLGGKIAGNELKKRGILLCQDI
ncbi:MAG: hypothetical protein FWG40_04165 [Peptococcaceae bacterium]|nr:hypothetical protein [Peptococcaceae bacterium]